MKNTKKIYLLFCLLLTATLNHAYGTVGLDNHEGSVLIKEGVVNGAPKGSSIQAELDGHWLYVTFTENLGIVTVEVLDSCGNEALSIPTPTPNGVNFYIPYAGSYMVVITLSNGDIYYGEFDITD